MKQTAMLIGSAGSGKTTELLRVLESAKDRLGGSPFAVGFVSMTRAARAEAVSRASLSWGVPVDVLTKQGWFKTAHGVCYRQLGIRSEQVIGKSKEDVKWLSEAVGGDVRAFVDDDDEVRYSGDKATAAALRAWDVSRASIEPLSATVSRFVLSGDDDIPSYAQCAQIVELYESAKRLENRVDYTDMLARFAGLHFDARGCYEIDPEGVDPEGVKAWIFDEAQDASALVDRVCRRLANAHDVIWSYVAGDPFQCQPEGTPVLTASGYKPIEELDPKSDRLIAFCKSEGQFYGTGGGVRFAKAWRDVDSGDLLEVRFSDGTTSVCTSNHRWLVRTRQSNTEKSDSLFLQAPNLLPGVHVVPKLSDGTPQYEAEWVGVESVRRLPPGETVRVHSLEVEKHHTYVTTNGIVTGNCIFGFAGSDYSHFLSWPAEKRRIMPRSYRCAAPILEYGESRLRQMTATGKYFDRNVTPAPHDGEILYAGDPERTVGMISPSSPTLVVARCGFTLEDWREALDKNRMPHIAIGGKFDSKSMLARRALWDLEHGKIVSAEDFAHVMQEVPQRGVDGPMLIRGAKAKWEKAETVRSWSAVHPAMLEQAGMTPSLISRITAGDWGSLVDGGVAWRESALRYGVALATRPQIRLGTIHASKGMEAETVVIDAESTRKIEMAQRAHESAHNEERRIEYVAITRAKQRVIVSRSAKDHWRMPL